MARCRFLCGALFVWIHLTAITRQPRLAVACAAYLARVSAAAGAFAASPGRVSAAAALPGSNCALEALRACRAAAIALQTIVKGFDIVEDESAEFCARRANVIAVPVV